MVRPERIPDREESLEVERLAFSRGDEAEIVLRVLDERDSHAFVAEEGDRIVGHVQMSAARIGETDVLALGPIGVRPDRQGLGIGSALVRRAIDEAHPRGAPAVILVGDRSYYGRFGFRPAADLGLANPFAGEIGDEAILIASLDDRASALAGQMRWHAVFGQGS